MREVVTLADSAFQLIRRRGWLLCLWFCLGWTGHEIGLFVSALLGADHAVIANLVFVLAVIIKLASLVLMVHVLRPALRLATISPGAAGAVPGQVYAQERTLDVVTSAVGPFLAVYAVWGFVDDEVQALFVSNYLLQGLGGVDQWSIGLDNERLPFYLGLAVGGWLLRAGVRLVQRRRSSAAAAVVGILAEGLWAFSGFVVLLIVFRAVKTWLRDRVIWADLTGVANRFLDLLPDLTLPFGPTVRELASQAVTVLPGAVSTIFLLPLMWLALAATVYGWRDYRAEDVVAGTRVQSRFQRLAGQPAGSGRRLLLFATADLRTKYLPVAQALRLIGRAGPRFVGAYLLLATVVAAAENLVSIGLSLLVGPQTQAMNLLIDPLQSLLIGLIATVTSVALYAAGFDRAVTAGAPAPVTAAAR